jgi:hypothetical protein
MFNYMYYENISQQFASCKLTEKVQQKTKSFRLKTKQTS